MTKTFEELIEEKSPDIQFNDKHDWDLPRFSGNDMAEFGKQVREATIKECQEKVTYRFGCYLNADKIFNDLPTYKIHHF